MKVPEIRQKINRTMPIELGYLNRLHTLQKSFDYINPKIIEEIMLHGAIIGHKVGVLDICIIIEDEVKNEN